VGSSSRLRHVRCLARPCFRVNSSSRCSNSSFTRCSTGSLCFRRCLFDRVSVLVPSGALAMSVCLCVSFFWRCSFWPRSLTVVVSLLPPSRWLRRRCPGGGLRGPGGHVAPPPPPGPYARRGARAAQHGGPARERPGTHRALLSSWSIQVRGRPSLGPSVVKGELRVGQGRGGEDEARWRERTYLGS
jgi:hypothetical protein